MIISMKKWILIISVFVLFLLGIIAGIYTYQNNLTKDSNQKPSQELAEIQNEQENKKIQATSAIPEKISPNSILIEKQYYKGCDHIIREEKEIPEEYINLTEEEFQKEYKNWKIEEFNEAKIIVYQEKEGFCGQHYLLKEHNGVIAIYVVDEKGEENWKEDTQIQTMYLPEEDLEKIRKGISIIGNTQLYSTIGDFE